MDQDNIKYESVMNTTITTNYNRECPDKYHSIYVCIDFFGNSEIIVSNYFSALE